MYKIDLHVHTKYSSTCGFMTAEMLVDGYIEAGYSAIAITDHCNRSTYKKILDSPRGSEGFKKFIQGYELVKAEGEKRGLTVYRGVEVRFDGDHNDYLVYNYPDYLFDDFESVLSMGLERFYPLAKEAGATLIQAHPCREACTPAPSHLLDGIEVCNTHPWHDNDNEASVQYAKENPHLITTGGSDCHNTEHLGRGGIITESLPRNDAELAELLKSGKYEILTIIVNK